MHSAFPQAGEWVWIKGDSIPNQPGNYGVQGVPSPTNNPPALYEPCEWTDLNGNFWMFGGNYNDLWKYDRITNEWTWVKGSGSIWDPGNYGTQGVPSPSNNPPGRGYGFASWVDTLGNFWMFGGSAVGGTKCDLWKYEIISNEWTWMKGSTIGNQPGIYGTQGVANPSNNPGSRFECVATWTDNNNDLWLFGGRDVVEDNFNDLWRYHIDSNQWTWMKGSQLTNQPGVYGTIGVENSANTPCARGVYSRWKDNVGHLWLFAGFDTSNYLGFNDLWRYNPISNNWACMGGNDSLGAPGVYGTKCFASIYNLPGARFENRASWIDQHGNFWFFGGGKGHNFSRVWNDLWMYCISLNQWIWQDGDSTSNPIGNWGTMGISNPANKPDGRAGAVGWTDNNNHLYMFGGSISPFPDKKNDLWKYTIDTTCGVCPTGTGIKENNLPKADKLEVFPNPTNSSFTISFLSSEKQTIELRIYNPLGKQVYFSREEIISEKFEKEINAGNWSDGIYFLQLKTKDGNISRKVMLTHP